VAKTDNDDECWVWTGAKDEGGYGQIKAQHGKRMIHAQRASWIIHFGDIPDGLMVRHRFDNPPCVNPKHLLLGIHADNMFDVRERGRKKGERNPKAKLTREQVEGIRHARSQPNPPSFSELEKKYNVGRSHLCQVANGKAWKD